MKTTLRLTLFTFTFLLLSSYSITTPLSGSYTIGNGGNYPTIQSAFNDASAQGISGPVIFNIITGTYNENVVIDWISGSSVLNTVTLTSQSGNANDVIINGVGNVLYIIPNNIILNKLSFSGDVYLEDYIHRISNITISNNKFDFGKIYCDNTDWAEGGDNILIRGNENIGKIYLLGGRPPAIGWHYSNVLIEKNSIGNVVDELALYVDGDNMHYVKNKIIGKVFSIGGNITNNFILGRIFWGFGNLKNNTIVGGSITNPTVTYGGDTILNNIIINPSTGPAFQGNSVISDYNNFYNGGNDSLIHYAGTIYNNISDFYNATGLDQHSNSHPVSFLSPTDLHLGGSSIGDEQLVGTPIPFITDDIDGDTRSQFFPYKGADENTDFPLPVELASFTSSVNKNNVLLNWTTSYEVNNIGFDVERKLVNGEWVKINFISGYKNSNTVQLYTYEDKQLSPGKYNFRLKQIDFNGNFKYYNLSTEVTVGVPEKYSLSQNYPNPFNPSTKLEFGISKLEFVTLNVYDVMGKEVQVLIKEQLLPGSYEVKFEGSNLSSGVYFYKLKAGDYSAVKKMFLMK